MSIDTLLSRLYKVKKTGSGNWMACCPAHDDKNPSMTIAEKADGVILINCFAGCVTLDNPILSDSRCFENRIRIPKCHQNSV